jgi:hypothetical protein
MAEIGVGPCAAPRHQDTCRLLLRFVRGDGRASGLYNWFVAGMVTNPVHVDIVLDRVGTPHKRVCFSAYMNERFSMTLMPKSMVHNDAYQNLAVEIAPTDLERISKYLGSMVDRVPYNYSDSIMLLPVLPHKGVLVDTMVQVCVCVCFVTGPRGHCLIIISPPPVTDGSLECE